jgi:hypothetical protein
LWASLQVDVVIEDPLNYDEDHILEKIEKLPWTLNKTYMQTLAEISQDPDREKITHQMLCYVAYAKRALSVAELFTATHPTTVGKHSTEKMAKVIQRCCLSLIQIVHEHVYFRHLSVKAFLLTPRSESDLDENEKKPWKSLENAIDPNDRLKPHNEILTTCLRCFSQSPFGDPSDAASQKKADENPFMNYAARYWPEHFVEAATGWMVKRQNSEALQTLKSFLSDNQLITSWLAICSSTFDQDTKVLVSIASMSAKIRSLFPVKESGNHFSPLKLCTSR